MAEGAPYLEGLTMAQHLQSAGIATLVIPDVSIFALMARVNKVLIGAQAVLATGGILGPSGSKLVAQAAKHYRVPFVVVTGAVFFCVFVRLPGCRQPNFALNDASCRRMYVLSNCLKHAGDLCA